MQLNKEAGLLQLSKEAGLLQLNKEAGLVHFGRTISVAEQWSSCKQGGSQWGWGRWL